MSISHFSLTWQDEKLLPCGSDNKWIFHQHLLPKADFLFEMFLLSNCTYDIYLWFWFFSSFGFPCSFSTQHRRSLAYCCYHPQTKTLPSAWSIVHRNTAVQLLELKMYKSITSNHRQIGVNITALLNRF